ncbi:metal-sensitive transcriptional regulator [Alkalihalobacillus trypoxylicola]|uniref:Cytoplasmic protein n=1 Tax=Alkalihalobacillus trypoxylicola TaxID=519424 RepID=A0A162CQ59_9BACI|nr:metal-sensitive transcriptional regulator [Alkalihalobacillus trypoxylicola]KYG25982.1 cytoplasmic protein [Alkalihalobacillus trypoxylicola]
MEYSKEMMNRLKRVEGQLRGVLRMMEDEKSCKAVITQLTAASSALDVAKAYIVAKNLENSLLEHTDSTTKQEDLIEEAIQLLVKSR